MAALLRAAGTKLNGSGRVLDIGCGTGWCLRALTEAGVAPDRLHGIEIQPARVEAARGAAPGARVAVGDARELDFPDRSFALVLLLTTLSSLPSAGAIQAALTEARRVLEPGGLLICYEPRIPNPLNRHTRLVRDRDLAAAGIEPREQISLTLLPPLARRLGARTQQRYERLARMPLMRTHRLVSHRATDRQVGPGIRRGRGRGRGPACRG